MTLDFLYTEKRFFLYAFDLTKSKQDSEDLIQDVALRLLRYSNKTQDELERIARVAIRNRYYDLKAMYKRTYQLSENYDSPVQSFINRILAKERLNQIRELCKSQTKENKIAFDMNVEGYKTFEIQDVLHENKNTVLARVFRMRKLIKNVA